ncbi:site-2 protease family protein [Candidatus Peregrinibacteria bacterium]|nr:site-2 protease family protein [Candidatus Peregrinibacteria bacterium]
MPQSLFEILYFLIALVIAISVHEFAHAFVAYKLGDPTAKYHGRLTLNPLAHLDPLGTLMIFIAHFGWGKPVPVNPYHFKNPVKDSALVSLAGPMSNFLVAFLFALPLKYFSGYFPVEVLIILWAIVDLNILLGIFNLLPFPPLDGSKIFAVFIPAARQNAYFNFLQKAQPYFFVFILVDIFFLPRILGFSLLWIVLGNLFDFIKTIIFLGS